MQKKTFVVLSLLVVLGLLFSACQPAAPQVVEVTKEVVKNVEVTKQVEKQVVVTATPAPDRVQVTWYIGLGAGSQPDQITAEKAFVEKYNKSQNEIQLVPIIVDNKYARDNLTAQIAAGNAPDIVGPVGTEGRASFPGAFLDLEPLIKDAKYDTSDIDPAFLNFYKDQGKLVGLPFAIFPEFVFVNKDLFKQAKLELPPQKYGDKYKLDGKEVEWNFDTLTEVAKRLTLDKNGANAKDPKFDKTKIVQYGYVPQWTSDNPRAVGTLFGAFSPIDDKGNAQIPESARAALKWYYDGMWGKETFIPNKAAMDSELLNKGNAFSSGKVAMSTTHLWYTCCIDPKIVANWDTAVMPSYKGKVTSKMHGDTFAIMAGTKNAKAAFKVYTYMLGAGSADLYSLYGGLPARKAQQKAFFDDLDKKFAPNKANWQVALDSIPFMDVPNHQLGTPNYAKGLDKFTELGSALASNDKIGTTLDATFDKYVKELDAIFKEKAATTK